MSTLSTTNLKNPSSGSNNIVLAADGTTTITAPSNIIKSGTAVASTSGTSVDFTGIPSWVKRVTVMFSGVSTNGTSAVLIQLGDSGGIETTGYLGSANAANFTTGFSDGLVNASAARHGAYVITKIDGNTWVCSVTIGASGITPQNNPGGFNKTLSDTLTQLRITTVNGTDTFDAGSVNILFEG